MDSRDFFKQSVPMGTMLAILLGISGFLFSLGVIYSAHLQHERDIMDVKQRQEKKIPIQNELKQDVHDLDKRMYLMEYLRDNNLLVKEH